MTKFNKQLIIDSYSNIFGKGDIEFAKSVVADNYIQHNPLVKTGKVGFLEFLNMLSSLPKPQLTNKPFMRFIAEGEYVAVHSKMPFMGKENAVVDLYRIENGKLAEHWDAVQVIENGKPVVEGSLVDTEKICTETMKELVRSNIKLELAKQSNEYKLHRTIGEGNFVLTQSAYTSEKHMYVRYDVFQMQDEQIINRWKVEQKVPEQIAHNNGMI